MRRDDRDRKDRAGRDTDRRQDRDDRDTRNRDAPRGPRGAPPGPRKDSSKPGGLTKPPTGPRTEVKPDDDDVDVKMVEEPQRGRADWMDDEDWEMAQMMGFARFKSTKNTKVPGNDKNFGIRRDKQMTARQYMNRQGGFNRPLSPSRG
jgi:U4/U6.U5 tri-snRNP-associated protein 3